MLTAFVIWTAMILFFFEIPLVVIYGLSQWLRNDLHNGWVVGGEWVVVAVVALLSLVI
jgi:hypothetical protein